MESTSPASAIPTKLSAMTAQARLSITASALRSFLLLLGAPFFHSCRQYEAGEIFGEFSGTYNGISGNFVYGYTGGNFTVVAQIPTGAGTWSSAIPATIVNAVGYSGYLVSGGQTTILNDPLAGYLGTEATGINDNGQIVGTYFDSSTTPHSFLYNIATGTYTTIDDPLAVQNYLYGDRATGINDAGQIVGTYIGGEVGPGEQIIAYSPQSYLYNINTGTYTTISDPAAWRAVPTVEKAWANDGIDIRKMLLENFILTREGQLPAEKTKESMSRIHFWAALYNQKPSV